MTLNMILLIKKRKEFKERIDDIYIYLFINLIVLTIEIFSLD